MTLQFTAEHLFFGVQGFLSRHSYPLRDTGDTALPGFTREEVLQLEAATRRAEADLTEVAGILDADAKEHGVFLAAMKKSSLA